MPSSNIFPSKTIHTLGHKFMHKQYLRDYDGLTKDEIHNLLSDLAFRITEVLSSLPHKHEAKSHVSPNGINRSIACRSQLGKTSYVVDIQVSFLTSTDNLKWGVKRSVPSLRVRTFASSTNPTAGLKVLSDSKDYHIFLPDIDNDLSLYTGYDLLNEMIKQTFMKVPK